MPSTQVADPPLSDLTDRSVTESGSDRPGLAELEAGSQNHALRPEPPKGSRHAAENALPAVAIQAMLGLGRTLMVIGILLLLFAAFQLWGTGLSEARAQAELTERFEQQLEDAATVGPPAEQLEQERAKPETLVVEVPASTDIDREAGTNTELGSAQPAPVPTVTVGDPIGVLSIPAIDLTKTFSEGTARDVLRGGPGHYPSTPLPGQRGNVAIAGHRTTHGAPFLDIDQLEPGDVITVETLNGTYTYAVEGQLDADGNAVGHQIVAPEDVGVIMDRGDDRLTLTACHPKYSARQRIIVTAVLISSPPPLPPEVSVATAAAPNQPAGDTKTSERAPAHTEPEATINDAPPAADQPTEPSESLGWQPRYAGPTAAWAMATALIALLGHGVGRLWRRYPAYLMTVPPLTLALYYCFVNLERFIPAV